MAVFRATDAKVLFTKNDPLDLRLGDFAKLAPDFETLDDIAAMTSELRGPSTATYVIAGYPDDEGIAANGGRTGAKTAPDRIRNFFYRLTPPAFSNSVSNSLSNSLPDIFDLGNLTNDASLRVRHENARAMAENVHRAGLRVLSLGGGHDYGYPDASAYCRIALDRGEKPLVINFDAHLDVRPMDRGITSGTPFFRLLEEFSDIDFIELGLQSHCNSRSHVEWLMSRGGLCAFEEDRLASGESLTQTLLRLLGDGALTRRSAFLSVDIDAFTSAVAPGASQSWPTGFQTSDFFECLSWCLRRFDVRGVGIYEVSPPLDVDDRTSRLAALIAHRFVFEL